MVAELKDIEVDPGMQPDEAITVFIECDQEIRKLATKRKAALSVLLPEAFETRGTMNTVRLDNHRNQRLKFEFKSTYKCDVNQLNTAKELLGDDKFEELFKTEYTPRAREYKAFLSSKSTDERMETAREIVRAAVFQMELSPSVSVEKA